MLQQQLIGRVKRASQEGILVGISGVVPRWQQQLNLQHALKMQVKPL